MDHLIKYKTKIYYNSYKNIKNKYKDYRIGLIKHHKKIIKCIILLHREIFNINKLI